MRSNLVLNMNEVIAKSLILFLFSFWVISSFLISPIEIGEGAGFLAFVSIILFIFLCILSAKYKKIYCLSFFLVLLFIPNIINKFFPSFYMGPEDGSPVFSYFTHIDIFLVLGILFHCRFDRKVRGLSLVFLVIFVFSLFIVFSSILRDSGIFYFGSFQVRYFLEILILIWFSDLNKYKNDFFLSFLLSVFFIVIESFVFSYINGFDRLTSGNYGVNGLGHLLATASLVVLWNFKEIKKTRIIIFFVFFVFMIFTGTKFSLFVFLCSWIFIFFIYKNNFRFLFFGSIIFFFVFLGVVFYSSVGQSVFSGIQEVLVSWKNPEYIEVTPDSSSMKTRLILWWGSIGLFQENYVAGIGPGFWPYYRSQMGIEYETLLDPHNDFLLYLLSYGLFIGFLFYFMVFVYPIISCLKRRDVFLNCMTWFGIVVAFTIAGFTNSVSWKHQLSALIYFSSLMILFNYINLPKNIENE